MQLRKISSEPEIFDPVTFENGINIITGERSGDTKSGNKTNGVGKTLLMSFIDFCLLSDFEKNCISKIPKEDIDRTTNIILEIVCGDKNIKIKRNISEHDKPIIYINGQSRLFSKIDDARQYLLQTIFHKQYLLSWRQAIKPFKRAEKIGFQDIINPDGIAVKDIEPYINLFGFNIDIYQKLLNKAKDLIETHNYSKQLKEDVEKLGTSIKKASAYVNNLKSQINNIDIAVSELSQENIYYTISDDIAKLDFDIQEQNISLIALKEEIKHIKNVPEYQKIKEDDILAVYNDCKKGLGDLIIKEMKEIVEFKKIIDNFKNHILEQRLEKLNKQKKDIEEKLQILSQDYKQKMSILDQTGSLKSLKTTLHEQQAKRQEYDKVAFLFDKYTEQERRKISLSAERGDLLVELNNDKSNLDVSIKEFEKTILEIHEYLYGNRKASFDIEVKEAKKANQKTFIECVMQVDDAGSARTEHEKILIFDFAFLFSNITKEKHLGVLFHDGAFEGVNEDTKFQLLNWLYEKQKNEINFQYIVTINRDSFEALENNKKFSFDVNEFVRKQYTKDERFLRKKYTEKNN